jgi:RNA polymerase sigma-70 factor (ECF subfamily)
MTDDSSFPDQVVAALPRLRRFARALARHPADADDLVQVAVERALVRSAQWRTGSSVLHWMFGILRNAWLDEVRARRRRAQVFAPQDEAQDVGERTLEHELGTWSIERALDRLPDEQRLAVALVLVEGLSYKEAADLLDVPIGTLTSRLARGRVALAGMLDEPEAANVSNRGSQ